MGGQKENNVNIIITLLGTIGLFECDSRPALSFVRNDQNNIQRQVLSSPFEIAIWVLKAIFS